jgi:hypothetical protein
MVRQFLASIAVMAVFAGVSQSGDAPKIPGTALSGSERTHIGKLIGQLGSSTCADREQAAASLEAAGAAALPFLREAAKSADAEVARRAASVIAATEEKLLTASLLKPRRFRFFVHEMSVVEAVAELSKKSGYTLTLDGVPSDRKVTLDTGETTFWDAFKQLCAAAGLVEKPAAPPAPPSVSSTYTQVIRVKKGGVPLFPIRFSPAAVQSAAEAPVALTAGKVEELSTCQNGAVRIRVLPGQAGGSGNASIVLEVIAEPRLRNFGVIGLQRLDEAVDDRNQRLALSLHAPASPATAVDNATVGGIVINGNARINRIAINGHNVIVRRNIIIGGPAGPPCAARTLTVRLDRGPKTATKLRTLSGVLLVQGWNEPEIQLSIKQILDAAGKSAKGSDGATVEIKAVEKLPTGDVHIKLAYSDPHDEMAAGGTFANVNIVVNGMNVNGLNSGTGPLARCQPKLFDATGKAYTTAGIANYHLAFANGQATHTMTYLFRPQAGQGDPAQLTISGQRLVTFRVPFALKDVPLP